MKTHQAWALVCSRKPLPSLESGKRPGVTHSGHIRSASHAQVRESPPMSESCHRLVDSRSPSFPMSSSHSELSQHFPFGHFSQSKVYSPRLCSLLCTAFTAKCIVESCSHGSETATHYSIREGMGCSPLWACSASVLPCCAVTL